METALAHLQQAADALAAVEFAALSNTEFRALVAAVQEHLHRVTLAQARMLHHGDQYGRTLGTGHRSMAAWLSREVGAAYGDTMSKVRLADTLARSTELNDAVVSGDISPAVVTVLAPAVARPPVGADVSELVDLVRGADPTTAKAVVEEWKQQHLTDTPEQVEAHRYAKRSLRFADPVDGMITATLTLPTLLGREVQAAVSHIAGKPSEHDGRSTEQRLADGLTQLCAAYAKGTVCGGRERPTLLITAPLETLTQHADTPGRTLFGDLVPAHLVRRYAGSADTQCAITDTTGNVVALTTTQRLATDQQWRALVARDGGCRHPDCHIPAHWCDIDHLTPWEQGGPTTLDNLALWCRHHHTLKHSPGVHITGGVLNLRLHLRDGTTIDCPPRPLLQRFALA